MIIYTIKRRKEADMFTGSFKYMIDIAVSRSRIIAKSFKIQCFLGSIKADSVKKMIIEHINPMSSANISRT